MNKILCVTSLLFIMACNQTQTISKNLSKKEWINTINQLEQKLATQVDATLDMPTAKNLISESEQFAKVYPQDDLAAPYLFKAGDVARGIGQYEKAIQLWQQVAEQYQTYKKAPDALFLQAFTYENDLKDPAKAKSIYEAFLKKHPEHPLAAQVKMIMSVLGKSPEELIELYKKQ